MAEDLFVFLVHGTLIALEPQPSLDSALTCSDQQACVGQTRPAANSMPPAICVASDDEVWASLLAQNLAARGATTIQCDLNSLKNQIPSMTDGSWVIVDGGWPMLQLQTAIQELNSTLQRFRVNTVMVVDELVGPHPLSSFKPDRTVNRAADMRVLVRELLSVFQPALPGKAEPAI